MISEIEVLKDFEDLTKSGISLIDFWAEFCSPCRDFEPVFESLSEKFINMKFAKANLQDNEELAGRFGIDAVPCTLIFKNGKMIDKLLGYVSEEELEDKLRKL